MHEEGKVLLLHSFKIDNISNYRHHCYRAVTTIAKPGSHQSKTAPRTNCRASRDRVSNPLVSTIYGLINC